MNFKPLEILSFDGLKLKGYFYPSLSSEPAPVIIFTHGISEYGLRHDYLVSLLGRDYHILIHDLRGHGRSEGVQGYIDHFEYFEKDLYAWVQYCKKTLPQETQIHLMGHSMGGLVTLGMLESLGEQGQKDIVIKSVFLSAPAIGVGDSLGKFIIRYIPSFFIKRLGMMLGKLPLKGQVDTSELSHSIELKKSYEKDPIILQRLSARLLTQLLARAKSLFKKRSQSSIDVKKIKIVVGSTDQIINVQKIKDYSVESSLNIELDIIEGALHEMHFETQKYQEKYFQLLSQFFL